MIVTNSEATSADDVLNATDELRFTVSEAIRATTDASGIAVTLRGSNQLGAANETLTCGATGTRATCVLNAARPVLTMTVTGTTTQQYPLTLCRCRCPTAPPSTPPTATRGSSASTPDAGRTPTDRSEPGPWGPGSVASAGNEVRAWEESSLLRDVDIAGGAYTASVRIRYADLVRSSRAAAGMTQAQLAERLGTTQSVVSRWERGHDEPRLSSLEAIGRATGRRLVVELVDDGVDRAQIRQQLALTAEQRLASVVNLSRTLASARKVT